MTRSLRARDVLQDLQDCRSDDSGEEVSEAESEPGYQPDQVKRKMNKMNHMH
jgi:hypothetical protein